MKKFVLIFLATLMASPIWAALEIDEKLTLRLLRTSNSKKTILTNRGLEDGLVVGTHAKFFLTEGVIARGVVIKAAPSRSVWSIYRIIDADQINADTVLNIKISSELRLTEDPTRAIRVVDGSGEVESITSPTTLASKEIPETLNDVDRMELESLGVGANKSSPIGFSARSWEVWGQAYFNSLSGTVDNDIDESSEITQSSLDFSLGAEKYFSASSGSFLNQVSIFGFLHQRSSDAGDSIGLSSSWTEFGAGANYHFYGNVKRADNLVLYGSLSAGIGSVSGTVALSETDEQTIEGSNNFFALGVGAKYILSNGWGARALLDFYQSGEVFALENGDEITRSLSGPRLQLGVSYRF